MRGHDGDMFDDEEINVNVQTIPTIPAVPTPSRPEHADLHPTLTLALRVLDVIELAQQNHPRIEWLARAHLAINEVLHNALLLRSEYRDRETNLLRAGWAIGKLQAIASSPSSRRTPVLRDRANRLVANAVSLINELQAVNWSAPLLVVKRSCGCKVEKLSDEDPGSLLIGCDEARRLNGIANDAEGRYLGAVLNDESWAPEALLASTAAYDALHAHFEGR